MRKPNFKILPLILAMNSQCVMAAGANVFDDAAIASIANLIASQTSLEHLSIDLPGANLSSENMVAISNAIGALSKLKEVGLDVSGNSNVDDAAIDALRSALKDSLEVVKLGLDRTKATDTALSAIVAKTQSLPKVTAIDLTVPASSSSANNAAALKQIFAPSSALEKITKTDGTLSALISDLKTSGLNLAQISNILPLLDPTLIQSSANKKATVLALIPAYETLNGWGVALVNSFPLHADKQAAVLYFGDSVNGAARRGVYNSASLTGLTTWGQITTFIDQALEAQRIADATPSTLSGWAGALLINSLPLEADKQAATAYFNDAANGAARRGVYDAIMSTPMSILFAPVPGSNRLSTWAEINSAITWGQIAGNPDKFNTLYTSAQNLIPYVSSWTELQGIIDNYKTILDDGKIASVVESLSGKDALTVINNYGVIKSYNPADLATILDGVSGSAARDALANYAIVLGFKGSVLLTGSDSQAKRSNLASQASSEITKYGGSNDLFTSILTYTAAGAKGQDIGKTPSSQMTPGSGFVGISSDLTQKLGNIFPNLSNLRSFVVTLVGGNGGYGNTSGSAGVIVTPGGIAGNAITSQNAQQVGDLLKKLTTINTLTLNLRGGDGGKTGNKSGVPDSSKLIPGGMPIDSPTNAQYITQSLKTLINLNNLTLSFYGGNGGDGASGFVGGVGGNGIDATSVEYLADAIKSLVNLTTLNLSFSGGRGGYAAKSSGWTSTSYSVTSALTGESDYTYTYSRYDGTTGTAPSTAFASTGIGIDGASAKSLATAIAALNKPSLSLTLNLSKSISLSDQTIISNTLSNITAKTITYTNN